MIAKLFLIILLIFSNFLYIYADGGEDGSYWQQGKSVRIDIDNSIFTGNVNIKLWIASESKYFTIVNDYSSLQGSYYWLIPSNFYTGNIFKLKIEDSNNTSQYIQSDNFFPIYEATSSNIEEEQIAIKLYPNPITNQFNISCDETMIMSFDIYNAASELQKRYSPVNSYSYSVNNLDLPVGKYFVYIRLSNYKVVSKSFIVKK